MDYLAAIKTFVLAADLGSLTRAAQELSIKTSTASRHLKDLEADLRIALFNRSTRGLALTEGGKVFYTRISAVLTQLDEARDATSALNRTPSGLLRVTMPGAFGRRHVMPYLKAFMARYADIDVDVVFSDHERHLIESQVDVAIRIGALEDSSLMARRLASQENIACATTAYLAAHGRPTVPSALREHQCLLYARADSDTWYARRASERDEAWQKIAVAGRFTSNENDALLAAALSGMGIALLPTWLANASVQAGTLTSLFPAWEVSHDRADGAIWAVYPPKRTVSSKVRSFIDFLCEQYGDAPSWQQ